MFKCQQCRTELPEGAQFCLQCGMKQFQQDVHCTSCQGTNSSTATFCMHCGNAMNELEKPQPTSYAASNPTTYKPKYPLDFGETVRLPIQIRTYFLKALQERLQTEDNDSFFDEYVNVFYESDFLKTFDLRAAEIVEESYGLHTDQSGNSLEMVDQYLRKRLDALLDEFILTEGTKVLHLPLSEKVLKYNQSNGFNTDQQELILDYLNLETEKGKWYVDFAKMPSLKLQNALKSYLFRTAEEQILLIYDQTIFGSCREGFALTDKGLYWNTHFDKAKQVAYADLENVENKEEGLILNGMLFNVDEGMNLKMMYLLRKIIRD